MLNGLLFRLQASKGYYNDEDDGTITKKGYFNDKDNGKIIKNGYYKGKKLYGKVQVVDSFPDFKVKVVDCFPDLKVQKVDCFPNDIGKW